MSAVADNLPSDSHLISATLDEENGGNGTGEKQSTLLSPSTKMKTDRFRLSTLVTGVHLCRDKVGGIHITWSKLYVVCLPFELE